MKLREKLSTDLNVAFPGARRKVRGFFTFAGYYIINPVSAVILLMILGHSFSETRHENPESFLLTYCFGFMAALGIIACFRMKNLAGFYLSLLFFGCVLGYLCLFPPQIAGYPQTNLKDQIPKPMFLITLATAAVSSALGLSMSFQMLFEAYKDKADEQLLAESSNASQPESVETAKSTDNG